MLEVIQKQISGETQGGRRGGNLVSKNRYWTLKIDDKHTATCGCTSKRGKWVSESIDRLEQTAAGCDNNQ